MNEREDRPEGGTTREPGGATNESAAGRASSRREDRDRRARRPVSKRYRRTSTRQANRPRGRTGTQRDVGLIKATGNGNERKQPPTFINLKYVF